LDDVLQGRKDGRGRERTVKTIWNLTSRGCSQPRENYGNNWKTELKSYSTANCM